MELRKDYILDRWVIIAEERKNRPQGTLGSGCEFCKGNEHLTTNEKGRVEENGEWVIRWFENKFPIVTKEGTPVRKTVDNFFTSAGAYGVHEVIVETDKHEEQLWDMPVERLKKIFSVYQDRISELSQDEDIKYVSVFKNHGRRSGTSIVHSHSQVVALNRIPGNVSEKLAAVMEYSECPYCKIIASETKCFENQDFVAFTPYASRYNYEIWVLPRKHICCFNTLNDRQLENLSEIMKKILSKLKEIDAPYNYYIQDSPKGTDMHFHIEVIPRIAKLAGFELSTGIVVNSVSPEKAAEFYRGETDE